jgi:hypothetical protein
MYGYSNERAIESNWKKIIQKSIEAPYSVVYTRQHISFYRRKIINVIDEKYKQAGDYEKEVIVLDFRTSPFRGTTLVREIHNILKIIGEEHPSLAGIIVVNREHDLSSIEKVQCVYIRNVHSSNLISELDGEYELIKTDVPDLIDLVEIVARPGVLANTQISLGITSLLDSAVELESEIKRQGLPL